MARSQRKSWAGDINLRVISRVWVSSPGEREWNEKGILRIRSLVFFTLGPQIPVINQSQSRYTVECLGK